MKFITGILLGLLLGVVARGALVCAILGRPIPATDGLAAGFAHKQRIAEGIHEPKILFVGGSSVDLGISAKAASEQLGIPCVNYGFMVPMGLEYILHLTRKAAKPGDTVVLALEYNIYDWPGRSAVWLDPMYVRFVSSQDTGHMSRLPPLDQVQILSRIEDTQILDGLFRHSVKAAPGAHASAARFRNEYGDRTDNTRKARPTESAQRGNPLQILNTGFSATPKGFPAIRDFCQWAKNHQVRIIATFPNIAINETYDPEKLSGTERKLRSFYELLGVPVIGSMRQAMFLQSDCYDTLYHLVDDAVLDRTTALVKLLKPIVGAGPQTNRSAHGY
jgi:hypothetical protein